MYEKLLSDDVTTSTDLLIWAIIVERHELAKSVSLHTMKRERLTSKDLATYRYDSACCVSSVPSLFSSIFVVESRTGNILRDMLWKANTMLDI